MSSRRGKGGTPDGERQLAAARHRACCPASIPCCSCLLLLKPAHRVTCARSDHVQMHLLQAIAINFCFQPFMLPPSRAASQWHDVSSAWQCRTAGHRPAAPAQAPCASRFFWSLRGLSARSEGSACTPALHGLGERGKRGKRLATIAHGGAAPRPSVPSRLAPTCAPRWPPSSRGRHPSQSAARRRT